jgi:PD-(D/E)XK nuclease superfamily
MPIKEAYASGLQPSMSRSEIVSNCGYAFGKNVDPEESSEAARYGSAFHELLASLILGKKIPVGSYSKVSTRWGVQQYTTELIPHVRAGHETLAQWLKRNEYRLDFSKGDVTVETAVALKPLVYGREIESHDEDHRYHGVVEGELPGTLDYKNETRIGKKKHLVVLDHKTGEEDFSRPLEKHQLLSIGAAVMRWLGYDEMVLGVLWARRRGMPKVYSEKVKLSEIRDYETNLQKGISRIGDGSMRPGPWCEYCPARSICPAQDAELLSKAGDVLTGLTAAGGALSKDGVSANDVSIVKVKPILGLSRERQLGHLYDVIRLGQRMIERCRDEIKKEILENPSLLPPTSEGEYLIIREFEKESLGKSSIVAAYGKMAGERMIEKLRQAGAIKKTKVQQLWPEKERGR